MERARIVVCDDEPGLRDMVQEYLAAQGYTVQAADGGATLRRIVPSFRPDLVVLDVNMPGEDGLSLTRWLRGEEHCAILMLTAAVAITDRVVGLEMGADDYLAKPFELVELRARVRSVLRRTMAPSVRQGRVTGRVRIGRCVVDLDLRKLYDEQGATVPVTSMEFDLLLAFLNNARRVLTRDQLLGSKLNNSVAN